MHQIGNNKSSGCRISAKYAETAFQKDDVTLNQAAVRAAILLEKGKMIQAKVRDIDQESGPDNALFREKILTYFNVAGIPVKDPLEELARERNSGSYLDAMEDNREVNE